VGEFCLADVVFAVVAMQSFDFQIVVNCPLDAVFSIYTDVDRWRNRNVFGEIRWVRGKPWEEGSRLRIETLKPIRANVDQVGSILLPKRVCLISATSLE
jgi:hypothetical protein